MIAFALGACASTPGAPERTFTICAPIAIDAPGATPAQLAALDEAIALWSAAGVSALVRAPDAELDVRFEPAAPAEFGLYAGGIAYVNDDLDADATAIVIAHELGHAFGLVHTTAYASVMAPGNLSIAPTAEDRDAIAPCD
jgi:hypothetical protein